MSMRTMETVESDERADRRAPVNMRLPADSALDATVLTRNVRDFALMPVNVETY